MSRSTCHCWVAVPRGSLLVCYDRNTGSKLCTHYWQYYCFLVYCLLSQTLMKNFPHWIVPLKHSEAKRVGIDSNTRRDAWKIRWCSIEGWGGCTEFHPNFKRKKKSLQIRAYRDWWKKRFWWVFHLFKKKYFNVTFKKMYIRLMCMRFLEKSVFNRFSD